ncbi:VWA domain-containing protein [Desulfosoma caldarium]|uniref:VWA domain containing CoxE-like protein n=1 Tax=Desulfosoma caldarium TaxID=610254 RepID=A0A3N1UN28_9BACT|nr:VWA domain-containing protein [Desulfosoma caldarium]ROQ91148.1 hypothetical protein EDC27_2432 [Desulfosoma caldarium]
MVDFIYGLMRAGIPISVHYILEFYRGLRAGVAPDLDRLFLFARLVFVKRVEHYDAFEQVFRQTFLGDPSVSPEDWENLLRGKPFEEWLRREVESGRLPPEALREFDSEELLERFRRTVMAQDGEHHGGNTWVGTGGRSPYGHSGRHGGGLRVQGESVHGTAQKVIGARRYIHYSDDTPLRSENLRQVLSTLKSLRPLGPESELDVDQTIERTAKNGGEIELVFQRELRNRVELIVLVDNGGYSMLPYVDLVKTVFNKIRDSFRDVRFFYFHNCIYGTVYADPQRRQPVAWDKLCAAGKKTRLIIIGDANMAPAELMASYGSIDPATAIRKPGFVWLRELREAFPVSVWLNPIPREHWALNSSTIARIGQIFHMEDLTLGGIKNATAYLNVQGQAVDQAA